MVNNFLQGQSLLHLSVPPITPSIINGNNVAEQGVDQQSSTQSQVPQQASLRGFLSKHEGPLHGPQRGIISGIHQGSFLGGSTLPQSNMISFANSFAHFPSLPSQAFRSPVSDMGSVNLEASSLNMCVDALYIHELHHLELRRRGPRGTIGGHHSQYPLGHSSYQAFGTQPQVHGATPQAQTTSRFETEKTPLLHGGHINPFS
jgi:hypothetical protein